jgi:hypothetical protein
MRNVSYVPVNPRDIGRAKGNVVVLVSVEEGGVEEHPAEMWGTW